jgi:hypothetical protein
MRYCLKKLLSKGNPSGPVKVAILHMTHMLIRMPRLRARAIDQLLLTNSCSMIKSAIDDCSTVSMNGWEKISSISKLEHRNETWEHQS